jgi:hypothetical protein
MHLSVALDGAGWHPAAWREPGARPAELFTAGYWADVIAEAERGLLDFVTIEDGLSPQSSRSGRPDSRTDQVRGRLDAVLIAARVAPVTRHIGLMPVVVVTHTEPFHVSKAIATLDYVSSGRAGVQVRVSASPHEAAHFGRPGSCSTPGTVTRSSPTGRLASSSPMRRRARSPAGNGRSELREPGWPAGGQAGVVVSQPACGRSAPGWRTGRERGSELHRVRSHIGPTERRRLIYLEGMRPRPDIHLGDADQCPLGGEQGLRVRGVVGDDLARVCDE